jgi:hypothetical protein
VVSVSQNKQKESDMLFKRKTHNLRMSRKSHTDVHYPESFDLRLEYFAVFPEDLERETRNP